MQKAKLRAVIFTEEDYAFLFSAWKTFLDSEENYDVVGIFTFPAILAKHKGIHVPLYYLKTFGVVVVIKLVLMTISMHVKRLFGKHPRSYKKLAQAHVAAYEKHSNPNNAKVIDRVKELDADLILSTCGYIFKKKILKAPKIGVINKHSALLPSYRGLMPVFWALMEGRTHVGSTIHFMDEEIDKGKMIIQKEYKQDFSSVHEAYTQVYKDFPKMMWDALDRVQADGPYPKYPDRTPSYFSLPTRKDYKWLKKQGKKFV